MAKYTLLVVFSLFGSFLITAQNIAMSADLSYISEDGQGWQSWEDSVEIMVLDLDGSSGVLVYDTQFNDKGFGADGGRWKQLDFYATPSPRSEQFKIDFNGLVEDLVITTGMMGLNEGGNGFSETGKWTAFDEKGIVIGSGLLGPEYSNLGYEVKVPGTYGRYPIPCKANAPIHNVVIEATGFGHGEGEPKNASYGENNSDFNIMEISFSRVSYDNDPPQENRPPMAVKDTFVLLQGSSITIDYASLLKNDSDPDGDQIFFDTVYAIGGLDGSLVKGESSFIYTPNPNYVGIDIIAYRIHDGELLDFANVFFDVRPIQTNIGIEDGAYIISSPIDLGSSLQSEGTGNRSSVIVGEISCSDSEVWQVMKGTDNFYTFINLAADKALEAWEPSPADGDNATIYTSNGKDWQQWSISNGGASTLKIKGKYNPRFLSNSNGNAIVRDDNDGINQTWYFTPISERTCQGNGSPAAGGDEFDMNEDSELVFSISDLLENDLDPDGDELSISSVSLVLEEQGQLIRSGDSYSFTPSENLNGQVTLSYLLEDGENPSVTGSIVVNIQAINDRPFTRPDGPYYTNKNTLIIIPASELLENDGDVDGDEIIFYEAIAPENGTLEVFGDIIRFRPDPDYVGLGGLFAYTITDGNGLFATREVGIVVLDNNPPSALKDSFELEENTSITVEYQDLLINDSDVDGDEIFFDTIYTIGALDGTLIKGATSFTYTPNPDFVGVDIVTYRIEDENGSKDFANIILIVTPVVNDNIVVNGRYLLLSGASNERLQVNNFDNRSNVLVESEECDESELWEITYRGDGTHKIVNVASGKAMEAWSRNVANGDNVSIFSDNNFDWQKWKFSNGGEESIKIKGVYNERYLTNSSGNAVVLDNNNGVNQQWILIPEEEGSCDPEEDLVFLDANDLDVGTGEWLECVSVDAYNDEGSQVSLGSKDGKVGPASGRYNFQVDYNAELQSSELLVVQFQRFVNNISFTVSNLETGESSSNLDETGSWRAFDELGLLLDEGIIDPSLGEDLGNSTYRFEVNIDNVQRIELRATAYGHGQGVTEVGNNSDYSLKAVSFRPILPCLDRRSYKETEEKKELLVYPNPSSDFLKIKVREAGLLTLRTMDGQVLKQTFVRPSSNLQVNVQDCESGSYILSHIVDKQVYVAKIMIVK